jgi:hypothetical protein
MKLTHIEHWQGATFRRFEHPTRGVVETLTYPCGRLVYVAEGLGSRKRPRKSPLGAKRKHKPRLGPICRRAAGGGS